MFAWKLSKWFTNHFPKNVTWHAVRSCDKLDSLARVSRSKNCCKFFTFTSSQTMWACITAKMCHFTLTLTRICMKISLSLSIECLTTSSRKFVVVHCVKIPLCQCGKFMYNLIIYFNNSRMYRIVCISKSASILSSSHTHTYFFV